MGGFHIENFGCRAARSDGEAVAERLRAAGMSENRASSAEVVVVNTCSVTAEADRAARAYIRRTHRLNPAARIMVTGCYAQRAPEELTTLPGVAGVIGNSHKALAPEIVLKAAGQLEDTEAVGDSIPRGSMSSRSAVLSEESPSGMVRIESLLATRTDGEVPVWVDDRFAHSFLEEAQLSPGAQTRPNLKVQEGCNNRCTFCVIPQTRGSSRSLASEKILAQVKGFVAAGGNELVLSGINLGRWGRDLEVDRRAGNPLAQLVRAIVHETALPRLRLSSIEPMDWDEGLIGLMREFGGTRLARHAHLPLQSGSDAVLRRMHRRYRPWHYASKMAALRDAAGAHLTIGADVMVGFPGESEQEFAETFEFIRTHPFGYLHLFPFSPRPGTRGWKMHQESPVPTDVVEQRMQALRVLGLQKTESHRRRFLGETLRVITLRGSDARTTGAVTPGLSENFLPVEMEGKFAANTLIELRVIGITDDLTLMASYGV